MFIVLKHHTSPLYQKNSPGSFQYALYQRKKALLCIGAQFVLIQAYVNYFFYEIKNYFKHYINYTKCSGACFSRANFYGQ